MVLLTDRPPWTVQFTCTRILNGIACGRSPVLRCSRWCFCHNSSCQICDSVNACMQCYRPLCFSCKYDPLDRHFCFGPSPAIPICFRCHQGRIDLGPAQACSNCMRRECHYEHCRSRIRTMFQCCHRDICWDCAPDEGASCKRCARIGTPRQRSSPYWCKP